MLNVAMVAERWGVSDQFVYDQIKVGRLQAFKLGNKLLRIRLEWVEEYEREASRSAAASAADWAPAQDQASARDLGRMIRLAG